MKRMMKLRRNDFSILMLMSLISANNSNVNEDNNYKLVRITNCEKEIIYEEK